MLPEAGARVAICEVWARDGIQGWPEFIPTSEKLRVLDAVAAAGITEVDATSFVSTKLVPQLVDGSEVLENLDPRFRTRVLAVNMSGAERAIAVHQSVRKIDRCGIPFSVSEPHNLANLRRNHSEHKTIVAEMVTRLSEVGIEPLLGVTTAFGCPIAGKVELSQTMAVVEWGAGIGVGSMLIGDTTGLANPTAVADLFRTIKRAYPHINLIAHFHDNRGAGIVNALTALGAGATTIDSCLGGMGGEPRDVEQGVVGDQGNVTTEDIVLLLGDMGIETGIDLERLFEAGRLAEQTIGRRLFSKVQRAGLPVGA